MVFCIKKIFLTVFLLLFLQLEASYSSGALSVDDAFPVGVDRESLRQSSLSFFTVISILNESERGESQVESKEKIMIPDAGSLIVITKSAEALVE
jgi:hypothetical protein